MILWGYLGNNRVFGECAWRNDRVSALLPASSSRRIAGATKNSNASVPSLVLTSLRQRQWEFFNQGCGDKVTSSLATLSGSSGTNVPIFLFQSETLHDPEFAK